MKKLLGVVPAMLVVLVIAGCGGSGPECSSGSVIAEGPNKGQCASKQEAEDSEAQEKHAEEVKKEEGEAEAVIKKRKAEETANQIEGAAK